VNNVQQPPQYDPFQEMDAGDENSLGNTLGTLIDGRWIIIPTAILFAIAGLFYATFKTPVYKSDALIQVEAKKSALSGFADMTDMFSQEASAITEIEVLKSRMVIGKTVDELNLDIVGRPHYFPKLGKGLIRLFGGGDSGLMVWLFSDYAWGGEVINVSRLVVPDRFMGMPLTLVAGELPDDNASVNASVNSSVSQRPYQLFSDGELLLSGKVGELAEGTGIRILLTDLESRPGVEFIVSRASKLGMIQSLQSRLSVVEKGRYSGILMLSLEGIDKSQTRKTLDSISKHYLLQNVKRMSAEAEKGLAFLDTQLPDIKANLNAAEQMLSNYRYENKSVDLSLETQAILEQVVNLDAQLNELTFKEAELQRGFTKEHPSYLALMSKRNTLKKRKAHLEQQVQSLPRTQQEILRHARDVEVNQGIYLQVLNKVNELNVVKAGTVGNVRILDMAESLPWAVKPRKARIFIIATILGLMVGIGIVFLRAALHRGVRSTDEIETIGLPVYATIPFSNAQQKLNRKSSERKSRGASARSTLLAVISNDDLSVEAVRSLRTSMHFAMTESDGNVLMITGPSQEVGKSFIAANLAAVNAQTGLKVLLIDADMRKGHMHRLFNLKQGDGLSEFLSGQVKRDKVIKQTEVEKLDFISCGEVPPNPSELLMLPSFGEFMTWAKQEYDLVIIDTPPVLAVTDATVIGRYAGISMLVAWFDITPVKEIEATMRRCEQNGIQIKGCILNGVVRKAGYGSYGHYGYYNYSYGKKDKKQKK
jgi:tyrosine-protein kinase Etk/Wzc